MSVLELFVRTLNVLSTCSTIVDNITAEPGKNITLPCQVPSNITILSVRCSNPELGEEYMFFYRDEQVYTEYQHPFFFNRVTLKDDRLKGGNLSLILGNVRTNDTGRYRCKIIDVQKKLCETVFNLIVGNEFVNLSGHTAGTTENETNKGGEETNGNSRNYFVLIGVRMEQLSIAALCWMLGRRQLNVIQGTTKSWVLRLSALNSPDGHTRLLSARS
ncbi:uncharacterized protein [Channa argus]|uniref:uncharacterized protein isoform X1 n=1 Tax=Channa argus TaxID=215402 RepID=UPI0035218614